MAVTNDQTIIDQLKSNWVWVPNWVDAPLPGENTAGRIVLFSKKFTIAGSVPPQAVIHCTADTRYKLAVNGIRVAVGPARSSPWIWYYDTVDISPYLKPGENEIIVSVLRYFVTMRGAIPFARTPFAGFTTIGSIDVNNGPAIDLQSREGWVARVDDSTHFPTGLIDDMFLHISERVSPKPLGAALTPVPYNFGSNNGDIHPWRLRPRAIPMPEASDVPMVKIANCNSTVSPGAWLAALERKANVVLSPGSQHTVDVLAQVHSTAFLRWDFRCPLPSSNTKSQVQIKAVYSEGYEHEPRNYPFFRSKGDRLDAEHGYIIGPFDEVTLDIQGGDGVGDSGGTVSYEPYWFRTFRVIRLTIVVTGSAPVELLGLAAAQVNYPMAVKASLHFPEDADSDAMWQVSVRTMRNCMFDGYSDCPFYEQLQYSGDSRSVGLFHYLLSGDDRLMRQAITNFGASVLEEGLTQSRFPSQTPQLIAGFSPYWILQVCDHHLYFGDTVYAKSFLPRIDGVLDFFDRHVDANGLVSGLPSDVWQYVDWVTTWGATATHGDKGVPTAGRDTNCHTFFSMLYAYVLRKAAELARNVGRPGHAPEYEARADRLVAALRQHCYDGQFFIDTTKEAAVRLPPDAPTAYSQHCQVFAVLCGACPASDRSRILTQSFAAAEGRFAKCSYVMVFYALRAFALAGDDAYETFMWPRVWNPWRRMLANNLSTWEEDDVRQRSDCHAWGSVPVYEYCTELAGVQPTASGASAISFKPRLRLASRLQAQVCLGRDNLATVEWQPSEDGLVSVQLRLSKPVVVVSTLPGRRHCSNAGFHRKPDVQTIGDSDYLRLFTINTLAPYILAFLPQLPSSVSHIVFISSGMHSGGQPCLDTLPHGVSYSDSKLHDVLLAKAFARLYAGKAVKSADPGWVPKMDGRSALDSVDAAIDTYIAAATTSADNTGGYFARQDDSTGRDR